MSSQARFLMCPPTHFDVSYVINPWMEEHVDDVQHTRAQEQWQGLRDIIAGRAEVVLIEPGEGLPDMPFAANAGLVLGDTFVPSRFRHPERQGEESLFKRWFADAGFKVTELPELLDFEGAGDALLDRGQACLWMGYGHRTHRACATILHGMLDMDVEPLHLVDARFYHLDTCFCPLRGGCLLYNPDAFDEDSCARIEARVPAEKRLAASAIDAADFACNAVDLGDVVVMHRASNALREGLRAFGYEVIETPLDEFMKSGGSAKCLTLRLDEPR